MELSLPSQKSEKAGFCSNFFFKIYVRDCLVLKRLRLMFFRSVPSPNYKQNYCVFLYFRTSLSVAAMEGHTEVVELLMENGAAIETIDYNGR